MITVIHGDDTTKSRAFFIEQKRKYPALSILDGEKVTVTELTQTLEGGDLFASDKAIFLEQLISKKQRSKEKEALLDYLLAKRTNDIFLWEGKELDKRTLKPFLNETIRAFSLPKSLFLFLDTLMPGNGQKLVTLFHETLSTSEPEMIVFMLVRQIRILLALSSPSSKQIDEVKRLAPWQLNKLQKQAKSFSQERLLELHANLYQLDHDQKTGNLASSLISTIDFLLLEI